MSESERWLELEDEDLLVPVSAIEHYSYCPRQCALNFVEQVFDENVYTLRGRIAHERVDLPGERLTRGVRAVRGLPIWCESLGLIGKADLVELRPEGPYPVEYKVGRRRGPHPDLQLCAQGLCLEEMLGTPVPRGALFFHATHRREEVELGPGLRQRTVETIGAVRRLLAEPRLPDPPNDRRCRLCALRDSCLPAVVAERPRLRGLQGALFRVDDVTGETDA